MSALLGLLLRPIAGWSIGAQAVIWIALAASAGGFLGGYWVKGKFEAAKQVIAVEQARQAERDAVTIGNQHEAGYLARMRKQKEVSDAKLRDLRRRLAAVPGCPVPVPVDWLRGEPVPGTAGNATGFKGSAAPVDPAPVADSRVVVETCERNRLDVCNANAEQLQAVQRWYEELRQRLNRQ